MINTHVLTIAHMSTKLGLDDFFFFILNIFLIFIFLIKIIQPEK